MHSFAMGSMEDTEENTSRNNEWILCITSFDSSSLPPQRTDISSVVSRRLTEKLSAINFRSRISMEYAFYENQALERQRSDAARALSAKIEERAQLLFLGESNWRYRQNIARIDAEIERLRANYEEAERNIPVINREPEFNLTPSNLDFIFPNAPAAGNEARFCASNGADAFLAGTITDFHGRYYLSLRLYTVYTRSFAWQDNIIFSLDDMEGALDEIIRKLVIVLSGNRPAAVAVNTEPQDALILINRSFAGRGETGVLEYPPGRITITASAPDHDDVIIETELNAGELAVINLKLDQIEYENVSIFGEPGSRIYHGALYVGDSPAILRLPVNSFEYIEIYTQDSLRGAAIFQVPEKSDFSHVLPVRAAIPLEGGRVDRERRGFYWAWGGIWISGIAAWIAYYSYTSAGVVIQAGSYSNNFYNEYRNMENFLTGSLITVGVLSVYGIYRLIRYLYTANSGAVPVRATGRE